MDFDGRNDAFPAFCPVRLSYRGDADGFIWSDTRGQPSLRTAFTQRLRARLQRAAPRLGLTAAELDVRRFSGISFRKAAASMLAKELPPHLLALALDHKSVETTNKHYVN